MSNCISQGKMCSNQVLNDPLYALMSFIKLKVRYFCGWTQPADITLTVFHTLGCLPGKQGCDTKGNRMQINVDLRVGGNDTPLPMSKHSLFVHTCNCQLNSQGFTFKACLLKTSVVLQMLNLCLCSQKGEN